MFSLLFLIQYVSDDLIIYDTLLIINAFLILFLSYVYFDTFCIYNRDKHAELRKRGHSMLGGRLKSLRGKRTQEEVAKQIGVSRARYSHYENGRSEPDYETLKKLADYYKVTIDYLLTGTEKKKTIEDEIADPDLQIAYRDMQEFSPKADSRPSSSFNT